MKAFDLDKTQLLAHFRPSFSQKIENRDDCYSVQGNKSKHARGFKKKNAFYYGPDKRMCTFSANFAFDKVSVREPKSSHVFIVFLLNNSLSG